MESDPGKITKSTGIANWACWKFQVRVLLKARNYLKGVTGDEAAPVYTADRVFTEEEKRNQAAWKKLQNMATRIIAIGVEDNLLIRIMNCSASKEMWSKLHDIYEQRSEAGIHLLRQKSYYETKDSADSIATHIVKIEDLSYKLKMLGETISDSTVTSKILMTLSSNYGYFIIQKNYPKKLSKKIQKLKKQQRKKMA